MDQRDRGLILIVEDEAEISSFVDEALRIDGYRTMVAPDGRAALSAVHAGAPDL